MGNGDSKEAAAEAESAAGPGADLQVTTRLLELDTERRRQEIVAAARQKEYVDKYAVVVSLRQKGLAPRDMGPAVTAAQFALKAWNLEELRLLQIQQGSQLHRLRQIMVKHQGSVLEQEALLSKMVKEFPELATLRAKMEELEDKVEEMVDDFRESAAGGTAAPTPTQQVQQAVAYQRGVARRTPVAAAAPAPDDELELPPVPARPPRLPGIKKKVAVTLPSS